MARVEGEPGNEIKASSLFGNAGSNIFSFAKSSSSSVLPVFCLTILEKNPPFLCADTAVSTNKFRSSLSLDLNPFFK
jgi:hypothetical protein